MFNEGMQDAFFGNPFGDFKEFVEDQVAHEKNGRMSYISSLAEAEMINGELNYVSNGIIKLLEPDYNEKQSFDERNKVQAPAVLTRSETLDAKINGTIQAIKNKDATKERRMNRDGYDNEEAEWYAEKEQELVDNVAKLANQKSEAEKSEGNDSQSVELRLRIDQEEVDQFITTRQNKIDEEKIDGKTDQEDEEDFTGLFFEEGPDIGD